MNLFPDLAKKLLPFQLPPPPNTQRKPLQLDFQKEKEIEDVATPSSFAIGQLECK